MSFCCCCVWFLYQTTKLLSLYQSAAIPSKYPPAISGHLSALQLLAFAILSKSSNHCLGSSLSLPWNILGFKWLLSLVLPLREAWIVSSIVSNCSRFMISSVALLYRGILVGLTLLGGGVGTLGIGTLGGVCIGVSFF